MSRRLIQRNLMQCSNDFQWNSAKAKAKQLLWLNIRKHLKNQSELEVHTRKSRLVLVLYLIGMESESFEQSQSVEIQNPSYRQNVFDTQLETALTGLF